MEVKYTNEKNIQMLIFLLKENNIKNVIVNPGTMNMSFVASIQNDKYFNLFSCVDERSACYMACGLAAESGEPVVLTCTGATASRNYLPGITEAFYRKLPVLAVTCTPHLGNIGHNIPQMLDRRVQMNDTYKYCAYIPTIKSPLDEWNDNVEINNALLELSHNGGGPVMINLGTEVTKVFDVNSLPNFRKISRYNLGNGLPNISSYNKIAIFVGNHKVWSDELKSEVEQFCEKYNSYVLCDHTSNYFGKYKVLANILFDQEKYFSSMNNYDLIIHIGETSGAYMKINCQNVWRVNSDGVLRDTFKKLKNIFEMNEVDFFKYYNKNSDSFDISNFEHINDEIQEFRKLANKCELPFSNLQIAKIMSEKIPNKSTLHLAILNTLRSWNYFDHKKEVYTYCNTGGFGIDGMMSTLIGASFYDEGKNYYGVVGDLAFFYDMNSLGNHCIRNNVRILLVNNGCGTEFHNYSHPANVLGDENVGKYIAADGHYGNKSEYFVKNIAENLGFEYISADSLSSFEDKIDYFCSDTIYDKPIVFEVFTNSNLESEALYKIRTLKSTTTGEIKMKLRQVLPASTKNKIKKVLGR